MSRLFKLISTNSLLVLKLIFSFFLVMSGPKLFAQTFNESFWNQQLPQDTRIRDLLSRLTPEEKISLLYETFPGVPRLGIPKYFMGNEALHGVVRPGKFTVFPQAIGLAATWNTDLLYRITSAVSDEACGRWNELNQGSLQKEHYSDILRNEWGFNGYVVSDCGAPGFLVSGHLKLAKFDDVIAAKVRVLFINALACSVIESVKL
jgi:hypothetical protein